MPNRVEQVQANLIAEINENGIDHVLHWIDGWYTKLANAKMLDQLDAMPAYARELELTNQLLYAATQANSYSTGQGTNLMRAATAAVLAEMLRVESAGHLRAMREACQAAYQAEMQPAP